MSDIERHAGAGVPPAAEHDDDGTATAAGGPRRRRWLRLLAVLAVLAVVALGVGLVVDASWPLTFAALLLGAVILRIGWFFLQSFATPPPPPPDPGELRRVKLVYRCGVCGAELRMTMAATEDPEPPRHCMEEMELVGGGD